MTTFASLNGEMIEAEQACIPALSSAAIYGRSVFTTVAIVRGTPFLWEKHWRRLTSNAETLGIEIGGVLEPDVLASLADVVTKNAMPDCIARVTIFDDSPSVMWPYEASREASVLITVRERRRPPLELRLTLSPYLINSTSPLPGVKSANYLENIMAGEEARARRFDEAVRLNEKGEVTCGSMSNVFWLADGKLRTSPLASGCLPGTTREFVMEKLDCEESLAGPDELRASEAVFLTSSGLGVVQAAAFDDVVYERSAHPILALHAVTGRK